MRTITSKLRCILLEEKQRDDGEFTNEAGKVIKYNKALVLTVLVYGGKLKSDIRKYTVLPTAEDTVARTLDNCGWGTLVDLYFSDDGKKIASLDILVDWSNEAPIE